MSVVDKTLESGSSAFKAGTKQLAVIANNIANLSTIAYKGSNAHLTDNFYETLQQSAASPGGVSGGSNTAAAQVGSGTRLSAINRDFGQGSIQSSDGDAHLAIEGKGFFQVVNSLNNQVFATRDGSFRTDDNEYLTSQQGFRLQGSLHDASFEPTYTVTYDTATGKLNFTKDTPAGTPATSTLGDLNVRYKLTASSGLTINRGAGATDVPVSVTDAQVEAAAPRLDTYTFNDNGELQMQLSNGDEFVRGQVLLMMFKDEQALMNESGGLYTGFGAAGSDGFTVDGSQPGSGGRGIIRHRKLESSNVDLTDEFAKIIGAQKFVQANARIMTTADRVLEEVINLKR